MQVLIISTYDYIRNTCLHYIDELELLCIALGCDCYMMNIIQHNYHHRSNAYDFLILVSAKLLCCYCFTLATKLLLSLLPLLLLLLLLLSKLSYYCATKYSAADILSPGVIELTTQLLILANILWLPLCRINKSG